MTSTCDSLILMNSHPICQSFHQIFKVFIFLICLLHLCHTYNEPPKLLPKQSNIENKKIIKTGTSISLECPVEKSDTEDIYFEWYKNGQQIEYFDKRVRITDSGVLKIKNSNSEDTGRFVCKAINGFGSVEFLITLIVLDEDYDDVVSEKDVKRVSDLESPSITKSSDPLGDSQFTHIYKFPQQIIIRKTGSAIRFKCVDHLKGDSKPSIIWFHNSEQFSDSEPRKGRNLLVINNLKPEDSGNYTCVSTNQFGTVSRSYVLKVIDKFIDKPQIEGNYPSNSSAIRGDTLTLHCSVRSDELPHIQWLKKIEISSDYDGDVKSDESQHYIKVMGELYKTLNSNQIIQTSETLFSNNLIINNVNELDAGKYVCLGANTMGTSFRSAFLSVYTSKPKQTEMSEIMKDDMFPMPILVAIVSVAVIILIAVMIWMSLWCQKPEPNTLSTHSEYESPAKQSRCVPSEGSLAYNQMLTNKYDNMVGMPSMAHMPAMPSTQLRASSPFYSELTDHEKRITNVYQMYTNPKDFKLNHCHPNKYGY